MFNYYITASFLKSVRLWKICFNIIYEERRAMEMVKTYEFAEMSVDELMMTDGGFAISACAWIGIGLFAGGTILGIGWALCD